MKQMLTNLNVISLNSRGGRKFLPLLIAKRERGQWPMKRKTKRLALLLMLVCVFTMIIPSNVEAATIKICKKSKTMYVGDSYTLYVGGTSKKAK